MLAFRRKFQFGLMLATAVSVSIWPAATQAYTPDEEQACSGDAFRLCSSEIPYVDRVTVCMVRNKSRLSPGCRVFFRPGPEVAPAGRPLSLRPEQHGGARVHRPSKPARKHRAT